MSRIITLPIPFTTPLPEMLAPSVYYFTGSTLGAPPKIDTSYTLIDPPSSISGYAIANSQDFYLTPDPQFIVPLFFNLPSAFFSEFDYYHLVTVVDVLRLDLIAYKYYTNVEYWWIIAAANNILDPFNLTVGTILRIPGETFVINEWLQRPVKKLRDPDTFFFGTI